MQSFKNFIGIDIGKFSFVVAFHGRNKIKEYENNEMGIYQFLDDHKKQLPRALCILEPTGGYELKLLMTLCSKNYKVHRAHTRHVKNFIRSYGNAAKTDKLDAISLSKYGFERSQSLEIFQKPSEVEFKLYELLQRRRDLKQMLVAEKNREDSPRLQLVRRSIERHIELLDEEMAEITKRINNTINNNDIYKQKKNVLKKIPGIGEIIANELLILLPELGKLSRRQIASLAGLAPLAKDSGKQKGYRRTNHGREGVKPALFLAAMAARNSNSHLKIFYENLVKRGKSKMVALTALMRKIIVIANARLRDHICHAT